MGFSINNDLKERVIANNFLFDMAVLFENARFFIFNITSVSGKGNSVRKESSAIFRKVKIKVKGNRNNVVVGKRCRLRKVNIQVNGNDNKIIISDKVNFMESGSFLIEGNNCEIFIGENTLFREAKLFAGESNTSIKIGKNCFCGVVNFSTSDFHSIVDAESGERINKPDNILIGDNNWITTDIKIRKGTVISNNSVIGSNSLVNKKFLKSNVIITGQPARIVRENIYWSKEKL